MQLFSFVRDLQICPWNLLVIHGTDLFDQALSKFTRGEKDHPISSVAGSSFLSMSSRDNCLLWPVPSTIVILTPILSKICTKQKHSMEGVP